MCGCKTTAIAYGLDPGQQVLVGVYNLGGGTFDISILRLSKGAFEVLSTGGDSAPGGDDFSHLLREYIHQNQWGQSILILFPVRYGTLFLPPVHEIHDIRTSISTTQRCHKKDFCLNLNAIESAGCIGCLKSKKDFV